ncbi:MAG: hypothetical protein V1712_01195 [Patescibacteria group bacterium]
MKTFYLWDLAGTLFPEQWNGTKSGVASYDAYVKSLGYDLKTISAHDYEWSHKIPYGGGLYNLSIAEGFKKVLLWTKNNSIFTTGNKEQIDWRAKQLFKKYHFDIRKYTKEIHSTFDYGNTNIKTQEMLMDIILKKYKQGYRVFIYTDDKRKNCIFFLKAIQILVKKGYSIKTRVYYLKGKGRGIKKINNSLIKVGGLLNLLHYERMVDKKHKMR